MQAFQPCHILALEAQTVNELQEHVLKQVGKLDESQHKHGYTPVNYHYHGKSH